MTTTATAETLERPAHAHQYHERPGDFDEFEAEFREHPDPADHFHEVEITGGTPQEAKEKLIHETATLLAESLKWGQQNSPDGFVVFATVGGRTTSAVLEKLGEMVKQDPEINPQKIILALADEREHPDRTQRNYTQEIEDLVTAIGIPNDPEHRVIPPIPPQGLTDDQLADRLQADTHAYGQAYKAAVTAQNGKKRSLILLASSGEDGHVGSIFPPGSKGINGKDTVIENDADGLVAAIYNSPKAGAPLHRLGLSGEELGEADRVVLVISGPGKDKPGTPYDRKQLAYYNVTEDVQNLIDKHDPEHPAERDSYRRYALPSADVLYRVAAKEGGEAYLVSDESVQWTAAEKALRDTAFENRNIMQDTLAHRRDVLRSSITDTTPAPERSKIEAEIREVDRGIALLNHVEDLMYRGVLTKSDLGPFKDMVRSAIESVQDYESLSAEDRQAFMDYIAEHSDEFRRFRKDAFDPAVFGMQSDAEQAGKKNHAFIDNRDYAARLWRTLKGTEATGERFERFEQRMIRGLHEIDMSELTNITEAAMLKLFQVYGDSAYKVGLCSTGDALYQPHKIHNAKVNPAFIHAARSYYTELLTPTLVTDRMVSKPGTAQYEAELEHNQAMLKQAVEMHVRNLVDNRTANLVTPNKLDALQDYVLSEMLKTGQRPFKLTFIEDSFNNLEETARRFKPFTDAGLMEFHGVYYIGSRDGQKVVKERDALAEAMRAGTATDAEVLRVIALQAQLTKYPTIDSFDELAERADEFKNAIERSHVFLDFDGVLGNNSALAETPGMRDRQAEEIFFALMADAFESEPQPTIPGLSLDPHKVAELMHELEAYANGYNAKKKATAK